jgi:ADP-ribose pyrophosphatase YjhB (NUDIX family)
MLVQVSLMLLFVTSVLQAMEHQGDNKKQAKERFFDYGLPPKKEQLTFISEELYRQIVQSMIISCVDVFVYDVRSARYFMVFRKQAPVADQWWYPGGRQLKGESFFQAAQRKCKQEDGLTIIPLQLLDNYSTIFPDSAWLDPETGQSLPTHTNNQVVLALLHPGSHVQLDKYHAEARWVSIEHSPYQEFGCSKSLAYPQAVYVKAKKVIEEQNASISAAFAQAVFDSRENAQSSLQTSNTSQQVLNTIVNADLSFPGV